ncbi:MFS transporter [Microbacterium sp. ET2]|uniref:MFS transporter n=1 Tax=Microbacterium albipurpureum TaxID=3050384 RepID=UPI00259CDCBC|nr:MFS transporter [Microbacterium sp. ET2 (Ac-2212)]WJL97118.1 MFS transporter [Microbacterium sp. ET2 (Ac-2212)]
MGTARHKDARAGQVIAALCLGTALSALNSGMIAVALSTLRGVFAVDVATVTWVISVFYLASAVLQPLMGRLADRFGPRRIFTLGMAVIIVAGTVGPFSPDIWWVCLSRVILAIGTAAAFPAAASMLRAIAHDRGGDAPTMIGRIQLIDTSTAAVGPVVGGVLLSLVGWQAVFWVNIPIAVAAIVATRAVTPADEPRQSRPLIEILRESDLPGILAFTVTVVALLMFLLDLPDGAPWVLLVIAVAAACLFTWRELRCRTPFIDIRFLAANAPLLRVYSRIILGSLVLYSALFGLPQYLEDHVGYSTAIVGALLLPLAAFNVLLARPAEKLVHARGLGQAMLVGVIGLAAGSLLMPLLGASAPVWLVLLAAAGIGVPYVFVLVAVTQSLYIAAPADEVGEAAGLFQTARSAGCIGASVVVGLCFSGGTSSADWEVLAWTIVGLAGLFVVVLASTFRMATRPAPA